MASQPGSHVKRPEGEEIQRASPPCRLWSGEEGGRVAVWEQTLCDGDIDGILTEKVRIPTHETGLLDNHRLRNQVPDCYE